MEQYFGQEICLAEPSTFKAIEAVRRAVADGKPSFLCLALFAPHTPIMPDPRFVERHLDAGLLEVEAAYASMIEDIDKSLGDLMELLEKLGIAQGTAVLLTSANGSLNLPDRRPGVPHGYNALSTAARARHSREGSGCHWSSSGPVSPRPTASQQRLSLSSTSSRRSSRSPESASAAKAACLVTMMAGSNSARNWTDAPLSGSCGVTRRTRPPAVPALRTRVGRPGPAQADATRNRRDEHSPARRLEAGLLVCRRVQGIVQPSGEHRRETQPGGGPAPNDSRFAVPPRRVPARDGRRDADPNRHRRDRPVSGRIPAGTDPAPATFKRQWPRQREIELLCRTRGTDKPAQSRLHGLSSEVKPRVSSRRLRTREAARAQQRNQANLRLPCWLG